MADVTEIYRFHRAGKCSRNHHNFLTNPGVCASGNKIIGTQIGRGEFDKSMCSAGGNEIIKPEIKKEKFDKFKCRVDRECPMESWSKLHGEAGENNNGVTN